MLKLIFKEILCFLIEIIIYMLIINQLQPQPNSNYVLPRIHPNDLSILGTKSPLNPIFRVTNVQAENSFYKTRNELHNHDKGFSIEKRCPELILYLSKSFILRHLWLILYLIFNQGSSVLRRPVGDPQGLDVRRVHGLHQPVVRIVGN
jgi:hypothetical protein